MLRQQFLNHIAQTSPSPLALEIARGEGVYLYETNGKKHLDAIAGIGVSSLGHCHPAVVHAVKTQAETYMHTLVYGEFVLSPQVELAKLMTDHLPGNLNSVYFVNSGAEATEGAMKLAKRYTGRREFIACRNAYHGSTQGAASLMSPTEFTQAYHPLLPGISHINFNCDWCLRQITTRTAAVIIETVQAECGLQLPRREWLQALRDRCTETGTLLVFDEIQAGYGRTGSLWAFEQYGVVPDILLLAKGMGGGMPIGAFVADRDVMQTLSHNPILGHITTFGGHPVSCAAARATLKTLLATDIISRVPQKEQRLLEGFRQMPQINEIRHCGLWFALELDSFEQVLKVVHHGLEIGLIVDWFLFNSKSIRIAPPLIISEAEIEELLSKLSTALSA